MSVTRKRGRLTHAERDMVVKDSWKLTFGLLVFYYCLILLYTIFWTFEDEPSFGDYTIQQNDTKQKRNILDQDSETDLGSDSGSGPNAESDSKHNSNSPTNLSSKSLLSYNINETSVLFLKTHKTAGSLVQNILYRISQKYERTVARVSGQGRAPEGFNIPKFDVLGKFNQICLEPVLGGTMVSVDH